MSIPGDNDSEAPSPSEHGSILVGSQINDSNLSTLNPEMLLKIKGK
jgi:hypothetical protein